MPVLRYEGGLLSNSDFEVGKEKRIGRIKIGGTNYTVYRKIIDCGALPNATTKTVAHGCTFTGVLSLSGIAFENSQTLPLPYVGNGSFSYSIVLLLTSNNSQIMLRDDYNFSSYKAYVILDYYR